MKKQRRNWPGRRPVSRIDQQKFQGNIITIFSNLAAAIIYGILLNLTLKDTTGLIAFFVLAVLHMAICVVLAINYNSKMLLLSALAIFVMSCGVFVYVNM